MTDEILDEILDVVECSKTFSPIAALAHCANTFNRVVFYFFVRVSINSRKKTQPRIGAAFVHVYFYFNVIICERRVSHSQFYYCLRSNSVMYSIKVNNQWVIRTYPNVLKCACIFVRAILSNKINESHQCDKK